MKKFGLLLVLVLIAMVAAGIYGVLRDLIRFTILPEYFTAFKFAQFNALEWGISNHRIIVAGIGFLATYRLGLFIGIIQGLVGLIHTTSKQMFTYALRSFMITLGVAFIIGSLGGIVELIAGEPSPDCFPFPSKTCRNFLIVGAIHNLSYVGALVGTLCGVVYQVIKKKKAVT